MFKVGLTSYGQSILSDIVIIDGIALLSDYLPNIQSMNSLSSYTTVCLDEESCGSIKNNIGSVFIKDLSANVYQAKTIVFYKLVQNDKKIVAAYSQNNPIVIKNNQIINLHIPFDFSDFANGFRFSMIQSGFSVATENQDGILHIDNPNTDDDNTYSVYSKSQIDSLLENFKPDAITNYVTTNTEQEISGKKEIKPTDSDSSILIGDLQTVTSGDKHAAIIPSENDTGFIGTNNNKFKEIHATTFNGYLNGEASSAYSATIAENLSANPTLSWTNASNATNNGQLKLTIGDKQASATNIGRVSQAYQNYITTSTTNANYPLIFATSVQAGASVSSGFKSVYTDNANVAYYNPSINTLCCPTFNGNLIGSILYKSADDTTSTTLITPSKYDYVLNSCGDQILESEVRYSLKPNTSVKVDLGEVNNYFNAAYIESAYINNLHATADYASYADYADKSTYAIYTETIGYIDDTGIIALTTITDTDTPNGHNYSINPTSGKNVSLGALANKYNSVYTNSVKFSDDNYIAYNSNAQQIETLESQELCSFTFDLDVDWNTLGCSGLSIEDLDAANTDNVRNSLEQIFNYTKFELENLSNIKILCYKISNLPSNLRELISASTYGPTATINGTAIADSYVVDIFDESTYAASAISNSSNSPIEINSTYVIPKNDDLSIGSYNHKVDQIYTNTLATAQLVGTGTDTEIVIASTFTLYEIRLTLQGTAKPDDSRIWADHLIEVNDIYNFLSPLTWNTSIEPNSLYYSDEPVFTIRNLDENNYKKLTVGTQITTTGSASASPYCTIKEIEILNKAVQVQNHLQKQTVKPLYLDQYILPNSYSTIIGAEYNRIKQLYTDYTNTYHINSNTINSNTIETTTISANSVNANTFIGNLDGNAETATNASYINLGTTSYNSNYNIPFSSGLGGMDRKLYTDTTGNLVYNPSTSTLACTNFNGNASSATYSDKVKIISKNDNSNYPILLSNDLGSTQGIARFVYSANVNNLYYNPSTNTLTCANFNGNASTASSATTATTATSVLVYGKSANQSCPLLFTETVNTSTSSSSARLLYTDTANSLYYNPSTNTLTGDFFKGSPIIPHGVCSTPGSTQAKTVTLDPAPSQIVTGMIICVQFTYTNTVSNPTLNVNSLGAKNLFRTSTERIGSTISTSWPDGGKVLLRFDGGGWTLVSTTNYESTVAGNTNIIPSADSTYNIGSTSYKWKNMYITGGNGSHYVVVDNTGGEPTIRPETGNYGYIGTSSYYWYHGYFSKLFVGGSSPKLVPIPSSNSSVGTIQYLRITIPTGTTTGIISAGTVIASSSYTLYLTTQTPTTGTSLLFRLNGQPSGSWMLYNDVYYYNSGSSTLYVYVLAVKTA